VTIFLGNDAYIGDGTLQLNSAVLKIDSEFAWTSTKPIFIHVKNTAPAEFPKPIVIIKAPSTHSVKYELLLDASQSRNMMHQNATYTWSYKIVSGSQALDLSELDDFVTSVTPGTPSNIMLTLPSYLLASLSGYVVRFYCVVVTAFRTDAEDSVDITFTDHVVPSVASTLGHKFPHYIYKPLRL
jgi:hypothetical protein